MGHSTKFEDAIIRLNEAQARLMDAQITIMTQQAAMQTDSINISNVIGTIKVSMIIITPFIKKFVFCKHQAICWPWRIKILTSRGRKSIYGIQAINAKINLGCAISRNSILTSGGCGRSLGSPTLKGRRHKRIEVEADDHHEVTSENIVVYQPNQIKFPEKKKQKQSRLLPNGTTKLHKRSWIKNQICSLQTQLSSLPLLPYPHTISISIHEFFKKQTHLKKPQIL